MKPSERIHELASKFDKAMPAETIAGAAMLDVLAIIQYLDEQYETKLERTK